MHSSDLPEARRALIASRLAEGRAVVATELAQEFGVSEDAVRRDLRALAAEGRCKRVYGGAIPIASHDKPMAARMREGAHRKSALARLGAATVQRGEHVFLDTGSTNLALVDLLPEDAGLTIVTNAVDIAAAVLRRQDLPLLMIGGEVDRHVGGCIDGTALDGISRMKFDRCFVGVCAFSPTEGAFSTHFAEAAFKRLLLARSRHVVALITQDKLEMPARHHVADVGALGTVILERPSDPALEVALRQAGVQLADSAEAA